STYTYVLLKPNASPARLEAQLPQIVKKYVSGAIERNFGMRFDQFVAAGNGYHYYLQPVRKIHLDSDLEAELKPNGSRRAVTIFGIIAVFILGIAGINFINLSTARSMERAKEVGIRKTFGSGQYSLVWQFLLESVLVSVIGILLAIGLVIVDLPFFNRLAGETLSVGMLLTPVTIPLLLAFGVLVGLIAGIYPAFVLSAFQPIKVLKGRFTSNRYGVALRNGLVVFQFTISIVLIICTIVVNRQMGYMLGDKLGFVKDDVIEIERTDLLDKKTLAFKNQLAGIAGVEKIGGASTMPGEGGFFGMVWQPVGSRESMAMRGIVANESFSETLGLSIKEGRWFNKTFPTDSLAVVLNEKAVTALGLKEPVIGARLTTMEAPFNPRPDSFYTYTVIGVVHDFHFQSLHQVINPLALISSARFGDVTGVTAVRIRGDDFAPAIAAIEQRWRQFVPDHPFHYSFLDQKLAAQYRPEQTLQRIFTVFSALAIFIACIGLLGLAAYATQQRIREICIRKVLGARLGTIVGLLSKDFVKLVTISAVVAFPLAYWAMHSWLEGFVYRVGLSWWIFGLAWVLSLGITLLTIGFQAVRAASTNPVQVLRSE
ncbi:MAG TPA: FtsX-like permease family protein, partial [Puia sp.]